MIVWELEVDVIEYRSRWVDWSTPSLGNSSYSIAHFSLLPPQRRRAVPYKKNFSFKAFHSRSAERTKEPEDRERTDTAPPDQTEVPQTQLQIGDF